MNTQSLASFARNLRRRFTTMSPRQRTYWAMMRAQGRERYVWLIGVCQWGLYVFLLTSVSTYYDYFQGRFSSGRFWMELLFNAFVAAAISRWAAKVEWSESEKRFWAERGYSRPPVAEQSRRQSSDH